MTERRRYGARRRAVVAIAASVGITALAATCVNYASASSSVPKSAPSVQDAAASVPLGGDGQANLGGDGQPNHRDRNDHDGRIHVNERTYSADPGVCTAVISSPASTFNVRNESDRTIEFFNGITCDAGAPIATIGPRGSASAIPGTTVTDGTVVPTALVGSFRAIDKNHH
ncbi:hypothetical protein [Streptomyces sp. NL15-2K]|uniref:hypothetical protein n=1 Tax=Streptomyces sp. NL15-2K TaxID=376149 RepID=UPI000F587EEA|nr:MULTISPECIES: hypothetical protein [Actinomycetes]WKX11589.1 hypothetical protein Q4V64_30390 [Kutzneria buriramensis]